MSLDEMREMAKIEKALETLPAEIEAKSMVVNEARKEWQVKKAEYEYKYNQIILSVKAKEEGKTQTDLKGDAVLGSHQQRLDMIVAEAVYRSLVTELRGLRDRWDSTKEQSYNLRCQIKRFEG